MTSLLVLLLGLTSVLGDWLSSASNVTWRRRATLLAVGLLVLAVLGSVVGLVLLGLGQAMTVIVLALAGGWLVISLFVPGRGAVIVRWAVMLAVVGLCAVAVPVHGSVTALTLDRVARGVGVLLLLMSPANGLVAAVLRAARGPRHKTDLAEDSSAGTVTQGEDGPVGSEPLVAPSGQVLHGGRWIGPLERILLLLLAGAGSQAALAAVIAAKGVIRFPEISKDESGRKAEEFLIGSLVSWTLAVLGALLLLV